jgi:hypothetical protein
MVTALARQPRARWAVSGAPPAGKFPQAKRHG